MNNISPLAALGALLVIGVSIEAVEQQNKQAAYALAFVIILGMITFNATAFRQQISLVISLLNAKSGGGASFSGPKPNGGGAGFSGPKPAGRPGGGGAGFK